MDLGVFLILGAVIWGCATIANKIGLDNMYDLGFILLFGTISLSIIGVAGLCIAVFVFGYGY